MNGGLIRRLGFLPTVWDVATDFQFGQSQVNANTGNFLFCQFFFSFLFWGGQTYKILLSGSYFLFSLLINQRTFKELQGEEVTAGLCYMFICFPCVFTLLIPAINSRCEDRNLLTQTIIQRQVGQNWAKTTIHK